MKYTSYFSQTLKGNGSPHLKQDMFAPYMNLVHLEGHVALLNDLANKAEQNDQKFVYKLKIDDIEGEIKALSNRMEPKELLHSLLENSII